MPFETTPMEKWTTWKTFALKPNAVAGSMFTDDLLHAAINANTAVELGEFEGI